MVVRSPTPVSGKYFVSPYIDVLRRYASALTAFDARAGRVPPGWGAKGLVPPRICETKPVPLIEVIFHVTSDSRTLCVLCVVRAELTFPSPANLFIVGSINQLKSWNPAEGIPLTSTGTAGQWTVTLQLPASITFEYKYIRKDAAGAVTWESDPNNRAGTPAKGRFTITDVWR